MKLIFVFAVIFFESVFIHLLQVVKIERAFGVDTLMEEEVFPFFFGNEGVFAVRAAQLARRKAAFSRRKPCGTDLTEDLALGAVIFVKERFRGVAAWAGTGIWDVAFGAAGDRADLPALTFPLVRDEVFVVPALAEVGDQREFVDLEFLVFWGMGVIKSPLFERDVSADEV